MATYKNYIEYNFKYRTRLYIAASAVGKYAVWCVHNVKAEEYHIQWMEEYGRHVPDGYFLCSFKNEVDLLAFKLVHGV